MLRSRLELEPPFEGGYDRNAPTHRFRRPRAPRSASFLSPAPAAPRLSPGRRAEAQVPMKGGKRRMPIHRAGERAETRRAGESAYASTYQPLPSQPVLITNATVLTAAGDRIERGSVLMRDGKIAAVGPTVEAPAGAAVVDGTGKWVTPGRHRRPLAPGRLRLARRRGPLRRQRGDRPEHRRGLGRALRLAAGPAVPPGPRRRRDHDADPPRLGQPVRRPRRDGEERARPRRPRT